MDKINTKEDFDNILNDYKKKYDELEKLKEAGDPSINHWRLNTEVGNMEKELLRFLRES